jgi:PKD repeat protein
MVTRNRISAGLLAAAVFALGLPALSMSAAHAAPSPQASIVSGMALAQPVPGHTRLVPDVPRRNTPRISNGEIWDLEVVGTRVFIAGSFTSIANTVTPTTPVNQRYLASYDLVTGRIDTSFRPTFNGSVTAVEASPDGTKLFVGGSFNTVNGTGRQKVASLNLTTGAPITTFAFTQSTNNAVDSLAATNTTLYVGGRFTRINGVLKSHLAAVSATTGAVDTSFTNDLSGGIGVNGALTAQQLKLTHDDSKLLVVHTGRQVNGQDRLGMALISTSTKQLLTWRSRLWDENLPRVGGVTRIYAADVAPNDEYFVVASGSGGDAPPISDTAIAYPLTAASLANSDVQPLWIHRSFDSIYSLAITEQAVYLGGHFSWNESPTSNVPWPGLDNVGYGTGQGLSGYGLGDQVVRREHLGALDPATGTALEWGPISNSFEGNKAMEATSRGLVVGGDGMFQGGVRTGRVAFYDFSQLPAATTTDTTITTPIEGRVVTSGIGFTIQGTAKAPTTVTRVQVTVQDRDTKQFLRADNTFGTGTTNLLATLGTGTTNRTWSLPVTVTGNHNLQIMAKAFGSNSNDPVKAVKHIESFSFDDQTPSTSITGPSGIQTSTSITMTGTAQDDHGVNSLSYWFRDDQNRYLQPDGTVDDIFNTFRGTPDVVGATSATFSYDVTLPHEGVWRLSATATDTAGQADLRSGIRDITINSNAVAPQVTISQPVAMTPPFAVPSLTVAPGSPMTFSGTASDDDTLKNVEITLRNTSTRENLSNDCSWGVNISAGTCRVSPVNINAPSYNWSWTTPFNLKPGTYTFSVRAMDNDDLTTSSANQGRLTVVAQIPGDNPPNGTITAGGTITVTDPNVSLSGTATDETAVKAVKVTVYDNDTGRYMQANGAMAGGYSELNATMATPNTPSTNWTLPIVLPGSGDYSVTAYAYDSSDQQDPSTTGATARYRYYPGDQLPGFNANLGQPVDGSSFTEGRIVVTGRAEDDISIARVEVAIVNGAGQYMSSAGAFTSTSPSYRAAFLNSPGSPGSNFSYTTPVIPDGTYSVLVRAIDHHDQVSAIRTNVGITVTRPANNAPVANATVSCVENVCSFDGRTSTDENAASLTYAWNFGTGQGTGTGSIPTRTYNKPGTYTPTLTVKDEWNVTSAVFTLPPITIVEPSNNAAPTVQFLTQCVALACATSSSGTVDPNAGDVLTYLWNFGDGTATSTSTNPSHTYALQGTYTVTLTVTDGWGKATTVTHPVTMTEPANNAVPTVAWTNSCAALVCSFNSSGTVDPNGDQLRYAWNFGDGTSSSSASPSKTYAAGGSYTVTLTVTDGWNKSGVLSKTVTVP